MKKGGKVEDGGNRKKERAGKGKRGETEEKNAGKMKGETREK